MTADEHARILMCDEIFGPYTYELTIVIACPCAIVETLVLNDDLFDHIDAIRWANSSADT